MRKITTSTYNQDEFLGDVRGRYLHETLGTRLARGNVPDGPGHLTYRYVALPECGPEIPLLERLGRNGYGWKEFERDYTSGLLQEDLSRLLAEVLQAAARNQLAVLLCCEPYVDRFRDLDDVEKVSFGCHRFPLARRVVEALQAAGLEVQCQHLRPNQFWRDS